jgi:hypothetical protein
MLKYAELVGKKVKVIKSIDSGSNGTLPVGLVGNTYIVKDYEENGIIVDAGNDGWGGDTLLIDGEYKVYQGYYGKVEPIAEFVVTAEDLLEDAKKDINDYTQTLLALGLNAPHVEIELVSYVRKAIKQWKEDNQ